jgi:F0F1-type ATP synthase assembly protein I
LGTALRLLGIGWFVALCIVGGVVGGLLLDDLFETGPILTLVGLGVGLAIAVAGMYRMLMAVLSDDGDRADQGNT